MASGTYVLDVDEAAFEQEVVQRSHDVPVVVDFWAEWCGPCRTLGPIIERAVEARQGEVLLAKVDTDRNQGLARRFGIRGIPAVKAFRDGQVVAEFVGAQPERVVTAWLDSLAPTAADRAVAHARRLAADDPAAAAAALRDALASDPTPREAALELARRVIARDPDEALRLVTPHRPDPEAEAIATRVGLASAAGDIDALRARVVGAPQDGAARVELARALAARGNHEGAVEHLLIAVRDGGDSRDAAREQLVALFPLIEDPALVADARRKLAAALY